MMTSNNNTAAKIPMRSLRMVCAAVSTILMFLKWFRVDIGGIAQLFSMDTSFSIFNLSGIVQNVYYEYNTFYRVVFALFVIGGFCRYARRSFCGFVIPTQGSSAIWQH